MIDPLLCVATPCIDMNFGRNIKNHGPVCQTLDDSTNLYLHVGPCHFISINSKTPVSVFLLEQ